MRRFDDALEHTVLARTEARKCNDTNGEQNAYAIHVRVMVQNGTPSQACAVEPPDLTSAVSGMRGEVLASRALALVTLGRMDEALSIADDAASCTLGIEAQTLVRCVKAIAAVKTRATGMIEVVEQMLDHAYEVGAVDLVVTAYRANPELLSMMLANVRTADRTIYVLARAHDEQLAERLGVLTAERLDPIALLSRREREVFELVRMGLSNKEIAKRLFISESTVKVHVHHVFDKLGIRSRTALALSGLGQAAPRASLPSESLMTE
jgi:DNA-binding NarL/FixJ family response regulator